ncbi:MAG: pyridoxal-dependent decarboxylase [Planctomycetota bacterium]
MTEPHELHMSSDSFREHAHAVVDWIADYLDTVESRPVLSQVEPGDIYASLPDAAPISGESMQDILGDVDRLVMPGITHWQSPNFFGFFPANISGPSLLGEFLAAGLGVQGMIWATSPACTEVETRILDWLVDMLDLPAFFRSTTDGGGVLQDTASSASLCALLAGRERATSFATNRTGVDRPLVAYTSNQAHSSIEKAMMIAGLGRENLRLVDVDDDFAMRSDTLQALINADRAAGKTPFFICATVGTTSSNAMDPVRAIGEIAQRESMWYHVDAAMSGTAALCQEFRWIQDGLEYADSYCFNPHKWMFTNFDCDCFWVRDRTALIRTMSILPEYLKNAATMSGEVFDYRDWHVPLGRRFRALKLWFVIRHYGVEGLQALVREHVEMGQRFAQWVDDDPNFERMAPAPLNLVCFRHVDGDTATQHILETVNASGAMYVTHTKLNDHYVIRMSIGQTRTRWSHVEKAWQAFQRAAQDLPASVSGRA